MPDFPFPPFLAPEKPWPPKVGDTDHRERLEQIRQDRELFGCDHHEIYAEHYKRLRPDATAEEKKDPKTLLELLSRIAAARGTHEQEINLPQGLSLLWADLMVNEPPKVRAGSVVEGGGDPGEDERAAVNRLTEELSLEIHECVLEQSIAGNGVFVAVLDGEAGRARVESYPADQWIPWTMGKRVIAHILFSIEELEDQRRVLNVEIHYRGHIKYRRYELQGNSLGRELPPSLPPGVTTADQDLPGVTEFLVQPASNSATSKTVLGIGDYRAIDTLIPQFNVQASQWGMIFDKHAAPTMYGPTSVMEWDEDKETWVYKTAPDGKYIPVEGGEEPPGYLVWDPQMQANFQAWDKLMEIFYTVTGTTPAAFSNYKEGGAASGTALRLRMARPLAVAGRKRERLEPALRRALLAAQQLEVNLAGARYRPTTVVIDWADGLPQDPKEAAETEARRKEAGLTSTIRALQRLDGLSEAEAEEESDRIAAEQAEAAGGLFMPGAGSGQNGPGGDG